MAVSLHTVTHHRLFVALNGSPVTAFRADTQHSVRQYIGTASFDVPLPVQGNVLASMINAILKGDGSDGILNQPVTIQSGHDETAIRTIFAGRVTDDRGIYNLRERSMTIRAAGWCSVLDFPEEQDLVYAGPILLKEIFRSLCNRRGVPLFRADDVTDPTGTIPIRLGGNPDVDDGNVIIPKRSSPLAWLNRTCALFGYAVFDTPSGEIRLQRVSGLPSGAAVATFAEGFNAHGQQRRRDLGPMNTYIERIGARYTDSDGVPIEIRSIPVSVPFTPLLDPPGYRHVRDSDGVLVTQELADIARNVAEIDQGAPEITYQATARGDALLQPGDVIEVESATVGASGLNWLTGLRQYVDESGYYGSVTGWAGNGSALPAGDDAETIDVQIAPLHVGDEDIFWYADPVPNGREVSVTFSVPDEYSSISYECWLHGSNSQHIGGNNEDLTISKIVVTQNGEEVGTADMPVVPENYALELDYGDGLTHWQFSRGPIPGRLEPGQARVTFTSGENTKLPESTKWDDWEIQQFRIVLRGVGQPVLPTGGD